MLTLLKLLKDGRFHSGEALGAALGISRSAVWKQLQQLQAELDLTIHKVRGRGYQLAHPLLLLDADEIRSDVRSPAWPVHVFECIDSTNAKALEMVGAGEQAPFVVLAEKQSAGRGRRGRVWSSPYADNVYYSLLLRIEGGMRQLEGLSLVVGLAVLDALSEQGVKGAGLKWPNDVLVGSRKLAGILLELVGDPADVCHVVLGIGINVNMRTSAAIDQQWTSLWLETGEQHDRNRLVSSLNRHLEAYLHQHAAGGFSALQAQWEQRHLWQGKNVVLIAGNQHIEGQVLGVDRQGALRLSVGGVEKSFNGGELSLRLANPR